MSTVKLNSQLQANLKLVVTPKEEAIPVADWLGTTPLHLGQMICIDTADPKHVRQYFLLYGNQPVEHEHISGIKAEIVQAYQRIPNYKRTLRHSVHFDPTPHAVA